MTEAIAALQKTPLHGLHLALKAKMAPFAGYDMPIHYPSGILREHLHTRAAAGLFDVSHMGQVRVRGADPAAALETLVPGDIRGLPVGRQRYTLFTAEGGGILDDLMVTNLGDSLALVVNAACKAADIAHLRERLHGVAEVEVLEDRALLALQGPAAAAVLARFLPAVADLPFMGWLAGDLRGIAVELTRSGYTGEDGFEISVAVGQAEDLARLLLAQPEVLPVGLGARDTLRLEAGLCLYGQDIDPTTTPVEAGLSWTIGKRRREEGNFPGAAPILAQLAAGPSRRRVGLRPDGRAPARAHSGIADPGGAPVGEVTSGGFGPSVNAPIAMGMVEAGRAAPGTELHLVIRDRMHPAQVVPLPFVPHRYHRG